MVYKIEDIKMSGSTLVLILRDEAARDSFGVEMDRSQLAGMTEPQLASLLGSRVDNRRNYLSSITTPRLTDPERALIGREVPP